MIRVRRDLWAHILFHIGIGLLPNYMLFDGNGMKINYNFLRYLHFAAGIRWFLHPMSVAKDGEEVFNGYRGVRVATKSKDLPQ